MHSFIQNIHQVVKSRGGPLFPFLLVFVCGILSSQVGAIAFWLFLSISLLILGFGSWVLKRELLTFYVLLLFFFSLGGLRFAQKSIKMTAPGEAPPGYDYGPNNFEGVVISYPTKNERGFSFQVQLQTPPGKAKVFLMSENPPHRGDQIRFRANLRGPRNFGNANEWDQELYYQSRGISYVGSIHDSREIETISPSQQTHWNFLSQVRTQGMERAENFMDPTRAALYKSLLLGDQGEVQKEDEEAFRRGGILHLLVVSGSHVVLLAFIFGWIGAWIHRRSVFLIEALPIFYVRLFWGALGAVLFCLLTDLPIPTIRSIVVLLIVFGLLAVGRRTSPFALWVLVALGVLMVQPLFLFDVSVQLSFVAVLGILVGNEALENMWGWVRVTLSAWLATLPLLLIHFHEVSVWSFLGNFIFVPVLGFFGTGVALFATLLGGVVHILGDYLFCVLDLTLDWSLVLLRWIAALPGSNIWVPVPSIFVLIGYVFLLVIWMTWRQNARVLNFCFLFFSFLMLAIPYAVRSYERTQIHEVHFLSVGQGDGSFLRSKEGKTLLIDTGPGGPHTMDAGERIIVPWLKARGEREIDLMILTHADLDHIGGAEAILNSAHVKEIWYSGPLNTYRLYEIYETGLKNGTKWSFVNAPLERNWNNFQIAIIHPTSDYETNKDNNHSIVTKIKLGDKTFLFTGDMEAPVEGHLLSKEVNLMADVLKVPHHGSKTSSTLPFLNAVKPKEAVIEAGYRNRFRHPAPQTLEKLKNVGTKIWRTDLQGEYSMKF